MQRTGSAQRTRAVPQRLMTQYAKVDDQMAYYRKMASREKPPNSSSIYKGVTRRGDKWATRINFMGRRYYIGQFNTEVEAAKAYNRHALRIIGPNAIFNQLPDES